MKSRFPMFITALIGAQGVLADSWYFSPELTSEEFEFNDLVVTRIIDATENSRFPTFSVKVSYGEETLALYRNMVFDVLVPFDEGSYLLGVSNSGLSNFAYFILDQDGGLIRTENHSDKISYCTKSVTVNREWADLANLDLKIRQKIVEPKSEGGLPMVYLESVTIRSCKGKRIEVWKQ